METCISAIYEVGEKRYRYASIDYDGEYFWITSRYGTDTPVVKWHPEFGVLKEFTIIYDHIRWCEMPHVAYNLYHGFCCGDYFWLLPVHAKYAFKIHIKTDTALIDEGFTQITVKEDYSYARNFLSTLVIGNSFYTFHEKRNILIRYDLSKNERQEEQLQYSAETLEYFNKLRKQFVMDTIRNMQDVTSLSLYTISNQYRVSALCCLILYLTDANRNVEQLENVSKISATHIAGENIYQYIKQGLLSA